MWHGVQEGLAGKALSRSLSKPSSSHCAQHRFILTFTGHQRGGSQSQSPLVKSQKHPKYFLFLNPSIPFLLLPLPREALAEGTGTTEAQRWPVPMAGANTSPRMPGCSTQLTAAALLLTQAAYYRCCSSYPGPFPE